jgi:nitroreductase
VELNELLRHRYGVFLPLSTSLEISETIGALLNRRSIRRFQDRPISDDLLHVLFATAFSAPSKSDLQQVAVIQVKDKQKQRRIARLSPATGWLENAPIFLVWCGDSRRIRQLSTWRQHPFANDHLDAFMNAAVDCGIAMQTFIVAAESMGLGCCPVSEIRDQVDELSSELALPEWVFPVAGLCVGYPAESGHISMRLPLTVTVHSDVYNDDNMIAEVQAYDQRREKVEQTPADAQRRPDLFGVIQDYGWSENRTRQYAIPMRTDFGAYIRKQGFNLS